MLKFRIYFCCFKLAVKYEYAEALGEVKFGTTFSDLQYNNII